MSIKVSMGHLQLTHMPDHVDVHVILIASMYKFVNPDVPTSAVLNH